MSEKNTTEVRDVNELTEGDEVLITSGDAERFRGTVTAVASSSWSGSDVADIQNDDGEYFRIGNSHGHPLKDDGVQELGGGAVTVRRA